MRKLEPLQRFCENCGKDMGLVNPRSPKNCSRGCSEKLRIEKMKKTKNTDEFKKKWSKIAHDFNTSPEINKKISEASKKSWKDPEIRKKRITGVKKYWTKENREKRGELIKQLWKTDDYRKKVIDSINTDEIKNKISMASKKMWENEEFREKYDERMRPIWDDPKTKENISIAVRKAYTNPEVKKRHKDSHNTEEYLSGLSIRSKNNWLDEDFRKKQGAISLEDTPKFTRYQILSEWDPSIIKQDGFVRDHKFSRKMGYELSINPIILRHPFNCEYITPIQNSTKRDKCSITLDELFNEIVTYSGQYIEQEKCLIEIQKYKNGQRYVR